MLPGVMWGHAAPSPVGNRGRRPHAAQLLLALLLAAVLPLASLPLAPPAVAQGWDFAAERDALLPDLPAEPAAAAIALVEHVYGEDFQLATMATMELLRRSGVPIVNLQDKVVALPDSVVLASAAVPGEFVPTLVRSVRAGDFYTLEDFTFLLVDSGLFDEPIPPDALAGALGLWGKPSADPAAAEAPSEVITAGAAVRALGAKRGQVYYSAAVRPDQPSSVTVDTLQVILIFAHFAATSYEVVEASGLTPLERLLGIGEARAARGTGNCEDALLFYDEMGNPPWWLEGLDKNVYEFLLGALKEASGIETSIPKPIDVVGELGGEVTVKGVKIGADKLSAVITTILWIAGIRLGLAAKPDATHFGPSESGHEAANAGHDVAVTAHAEFEFPFSETGLSKEAVACLKLLTDIEVFQNESLPGFKVRWSLEQPKDASGHGKLLRPLSKYNQAFFSGGSGGAMTERDGTSTVVLQPAYENRPGKGPGNTESVSIIASLDKDEFPFKMKDLLGLKNPAQFAFDRIFDLANSAIRRLGLPKQRVAVQVGYHGTDILVIEGKTTLFAIYYFLPIEVKLWTCEGFKGQWQGTTGFDGDRTFMGDALNQVFDQDLPPDASLHQQESFPLDLNDGYATTRILASEIGLEIEVDPNRALGSSGAIDLGYRRGVIIGDAELTIAGHPAGFLAIFDGRNATFDVRRYRAGERNDLCPNAGDTSYFRNR